MDSKTIKTFAWYFQFLNRTALVELYMFSSKGRYTVKIKKPKYLLKKLCPFCKEYFIFAPAFYQTIIHDFNKKNKYIN